MSLAQYTFQKITIGLFGVVSFLLLILSGHSGIRKYAWYMFAGAVVISLICLFLFILTVSKKFSDLIMKLARKLVNQKSRLYPLLDKAQVSIDYLQEQGRIVWKDKRLFLTVVGLDFFKFACWYAIPGFSLPEVILSQLQPVWDLLPSATWLAVSCWHHPVSVRLTLYSRCSSPVSFRTAMP